jgi:hypothetical protein
MAVVEIPARKGKAAWMPPHNAAFSCGSGRKFNHCHGRV